MTAKGAVSRLPARTATGMALAAFAARMPGSESGQGWIARLNAGVFDLPADDLVHINEWFAYSRCVTAGVLAVVAFGLQRTVLPDLPLAWILGPCAAEALVSLLYRRWIHARRGLATLVYTQFVVDVVMITIGLSAVSRFSSAFHLLYLMAIVPCALFSLLCGLVMAVLATAGHLLLAYAAPAGWANGDVVVPILVFFVVALQSRFYGERLSTKSRQLDTEARMSAGLLTVVRALATESSSGSLLQRVTELARELTGGTWTCLVVRDLVRGTYRVMGLSSRSGKLDEEIRSVDFKAEGFDHALAHLPPDTCLIVRSTEGAPIPPQLMSRWTIGPFLGAALRRGGDGLGMLLLGQDDPATAFQSATQRLLAGIAHHTVLALDNARLVDELRTASTLKSEFIGTMSHELRSPLNAIIGYTEMLRDEAAAETGPDAESREATLSRVRFYAVQLLEMIQATLDISRLEAGRLPVQTSATDLAAFLAEVRSGIPEYWSKPEVRVEWSSPAHLPNVEVDAAKVATIVRNLVHNALKFTDQGRVTVQAHLEVGHGDFDDEAPPDQLVITVSDTGIGILPEQLDVVFEMFRQGDGSDRRRHGGVGLGLYIVQRLVQALGGTVRVESQPGKGSTFTVQLPVRAAGVRRIAVAVG
jgi:signal transduction histidine kinase